MSAGLVRSLFPGALDIVGDVHGEIDALRALLARLGYDQHGEHRHGRRLVFVQCQVPSLLGSSNSSSMYNSTLLAAAQNSY